MHNIAGTKQRQARLEALMSLCKITGTRLPVIQAPMAGVQNSALAIAVSRAGGLGSLPCATLGAEQLHDELVAITNATSMPYNINFFCHQTPQPNEQRDAEWMELLTPYFDELGLDVSRLPPAGASRQPFSEQMADVIESFRPPVVSFHFGLPSAELVTRVKSWGSTIFSSATTVKEALWLQANGADAIIAQGYEAGGHRGMFLTEDLSTQSGTFALLPQIVKAVRVPVIAAGGIVDPQSVQAALALGASAVQCGTSYLLCDEATTSKVHRSMLENAELTQHTALTNVFSGRPARGIVNRLMKEIGPTCERAPQFPLAASLVTNLRSQAEAAGKGDFSPLWCGQNAAGCEPISAQAMTSKLAGI